MKVKMLAAIAAFGLVAAPFAYADDSAAMSGSNNMSGMPSMSGMGAGGPGAMSGTSPAPSGAMSGTSSDMQNNDSSSKNGTSPDTATGDDDY